MFSRRRPAEMIGVRLLLSPERTTSWLIADEFDGEDIEAAEAGEASEADQYHDDHASPCWRYRLVMATVVVIALAGLGAVGRICLSRCVRRGCLGGVPTLHQRHAERERSE